MTYLAIATVGFIIIWFFVRRRRLKYAVVASFIYLVEQRDFHNYVISGTLEGGAV